MNGSSESTEIEITTEEAILTEATKGEFYYLESIFRRDRYVKKGEPGGNLLKTLKEGTKINMTFTGETTDEAAVFQIKKSDVKPANFLCYCSNDGSYYLAVDTENEGQVKLCQLDSSPKEDKYFFKLKAVNNEVDPFHTFRSLTGKNKYLHCEEDGSVSVSEATSFEENGAPSNRQTWFRKRQLKGDVCQCREESNETCVECEIATISETVEDNKDSGKCISMETATDEVIEDEDASYDQEKGTRNEQGKGKYKDLPEVVSAENPIKESSEESGKANSEDLDVGKEKGCCRYPGREKSEEPKEVILADPKEGIPGNAAKENFEDSVTRKYPQGNAGTFD